MPGIHLVPDEALGNTSYLIEAGDGGAVSVDPRRDVEEHLAIAAGLGVRIGAVLETHLHADFVSGSRELAQATGADILAPRGSELGFEHRAVDDGAHVRIGDLRIDVLHTPGHTPEHVSYVVSRDGGTAVFSGGALIVGGAARTDLNGDEHTEELARALFGSVRRLAGLPDATAVYPTHGAGSFCSTGGGRERTSTLGDERRTNPLLAIDGEDAFVKHLLGGFGSYPLYFRRLRDLNRAGPPLLRELEPPRALPPAEAAARVGGGAWLVDARPVREWAAGHPRGAVSISIEGSFASWLGWVVPFGAPFVLLADDSARAEALRLACRIGYERALGWVEGGYDAWSAAGLPTGRVELLRPDEAASRARGGALLLDVRQTSEWAAGRIPGARHVELGELIAGRTLDAHEVITYCGHGERSGTAASLLAAGGASVASLAGGISAWRRAGLPVGR